MLSIILWALAFLSLFACATSSSVDTTNTTDPVPVLPAEQPGIRGVITKADSTAGSSYILVEENPNDISGSNKASVRINDQTKIYRRSGSVIEKTGEPALTSGKKVSIWFEGPVAESYPVQGTAAVVVLES